MPPAPIPKVDLHLHQERLARAQQVAAVRGGPPPTDWARWRSGLADIAPGMPRLQALWEAGEGGDRGDGEAMRLARFEQTLVESARAGAMLTELRVGNELLLWPSVMATLREAEARVRVAFPHFHADLVGTIKLWVPPDELEQVVRACTGLALEELGGVDLLYKPYADEADWPPIHRIAEHLADAGLGITVHAGELSSANIAAALRTPGITRIGHAVHAAGDAHLTELIAEAGVTVECCITSNVLLGAVASVETHPIRWFVDNRIPIVLGTDNPLQFGTSIEQEYALAGDHGLTSDQLRSVTAHAIDVSFASSSRKDALRSSLTTRPDSSDST
jgi:adenosine deaminase